MRSPRVFVSLSALAVVVSHASAAQLHRVHDPGGTNGFVATIPLAPDAGSTLMLSVSVNGSAPGWWVLDSGASECLVDRSTARQLRLVARGGRGVSGAGKGTVRLDSIRSSVTLRLAGKSLPACEHFGAVDLSGIPAAHRVSGLLGYEFFARYVVQIDFARHTLTLYDPAKYRYAGNGDTLQLHMVRKLPRVDVRIKTARRPEVVRSLIVDTGSEDAVDDSTVRRSPAGPAVTVGTTGLGKSYEAVIGTLDTVTIGKIVFTKIPGVASDVGIVGNGIWSRFVCVFDYSRKRLIIERPVANQPHERH